MMSHPSDLTDLEWARFEPLLPDHTAKGRPWSWTLRDYVNAIFYVHGTGCTWRTLPREYPPWQSVYSRLQLWKRTGVWTRVLEAWARNARESAGPAPAASLPFIERRSA